MLILNCHISGNVTMFCTFHNSINSFQHCLLSPYTYNNCGLNEWILVKFRFYKSKKMSQSCSMHGGDQKCINNYGLESWSEKITQKT
jgi:hypothetical protein